MQKDLLLEILCFLSGSTSMSFFFFGVLNLKKDSMDPGGLGGVLLFTYGGGGSNFWNGRSGEDI